MKLNWNFVELMKKGREVYINSKSFQEFFKDKAGIKDNDKILDVGCGIGTVPHLLNKIYGKNIEILGIDLEPDLIRWGQKHWGNRENIHLSQGDVCNLNFSTNEFNVIISFGLLEWLENPLTGLNEMIRVNKSNGEFITLVIEKSKFEKFPSKEQDQEFYKDYLKGIKKLGHPIKNEGNYIEGLFSKRDFNTSSFEFLIENKTIITTELLELWEKTYQQESLSDYIKTSSDFYFQFLKQVGWTKTRLIKYLDEEFSLEKIIEFYREHLGEEMGRRETLVLLKSSKNNE